MKKSKTYSQRIFKNMTHIYLSTVSSLLGCLWGQGKPSIEWHSEHNKSNNRLNSVFLVILGPCWSHMLSQCWAKNDALLLGWVTPQKGVHRFGSFRGYLGPMLGLCWLHLRFIFGSILPTWAQNNYGHDSMQNQASWGIRNLRTKIIQLTLQAP